MELSVHCSTAADTTCTQCAQPIHRSPTLNAAPAKAAGHQNAVGAAQLVPCSCRVQEKG